MNRARLFLALGLIASLVVLNAPAGRAAFTRAGGIYCTGSWWYWPGEGSGRCSGGGPDAGVGLDDEGQPIVATGGWTWNLTFNDPCVQVGLSPLGFASGPITGSMSAVTANGLSWPAMSADMQSIRVGAAMVFQINNYRIDPDSPYDAGTQSILPGVGVGTWIPMNAATPIGSCDYPLARQVAIVGATHTAA